MADSTYSTAEPGAAEYEVPPDTPTVRFRIRCDCGNERRNVRAVSEGIEFLRRAAPPPSLVVLSFWCNKCKKAVKVTAKQLGIAA